MYFRFASTICLVVAISLFGVGLEKEALSLRREVSRQHFRADILGDNRAKLRWECEQLGAPQRLIEQLPSENSTAEQSDQSSSSKESPKKSRTKSKAKSKGKKTAQLKALPLLDWQQSLSDDEQ
ncbi:MAG: hypothetical protein ACKVT0_14390 [Planctomycetaceae bacterium]